MNVCVFVFVELIFILILPLTFDGEASANWVRKWQRSLLKFKMSTSLMIYSAMSLNTDNTSPWKILMSSINHGWNWRWWNAVAIWCSLLCAHFMKNVGKDKKRFLIHCVAHRRVKVDIHQSIIYVDTSVFHFNSFTACWAKLKTVFKQTNKQTNFNENAKTLQRTKTQYSIQQKDRSKHALYTNRTVNE